MLPERPQIPGLWVGDRGGGSDGDAAWRGAEWTCRAVGGVLLGGLLLVLPGMYGVGYPVLGRGVAGGYGIAFLLALLLGKIVATSLTIGIGGSGVCSRPACSSARWPVPPTGRRSTR